MQKKQETRRVIVERNDGERFTAVELTTLIGFSSGGRTTWSKGSTDWRLADGRALNTDNDREFDDLDGRNYTLVD